MKKFGFLTIALMFAAISSAADAPPVPAGIGPGVYYLEGGKWLPLAAETVEWETSRKPLRVAKRLAATAIGNGGTKGRVPASGSPTHFAEPLELLVAKPLDAAIEQYQLLHLHAHDDSREFNPGTGAASHTFGGSDRDELSFASAPFGAGTYRITFSSLPVGEYGLLAAGGKIYTFRITATEVDGPAVAGWHIASRK